MAKKILFLGILVIMLVFGMVLTGCATSQVSSIVIYDNSVLMAKPYDMLSQEIVRLELSQVESSGLSLSTQVTTRTIHDRILEKIRETYPNADEVLIVSLEAVAKKTSSMAGNTSPEYTYVANVYPIKGLLINKLYINYK